MKNRPAFLLLLYLAILVFCISCHSPEKEHEPDTATVQTPIRPDVSQYRDSLISMVDSLDKLSDSLQKSFYVVMDAMGDTFYLSHQWNENFYTADEALMAFTEPDGKFRLLANMYHGGSRYNNRSMDIIFADTTFSANRDSARKNRLENLLHLGILICACSFEQQVYSGEDAQLIGKAIATHPKAGIHFRFVGDTRVFERLKNKDRKGITATWNLAAALRKRKEIQLVLASLPMK